MENEEIKFLGTLIYNWVIDTFLTVPFLTNLFAILILLWVSKNLSTWLLKHAFQKSEEEQNLPLTAFYDVTPGELAFFGCGLIVLWGTDLIFNIFQTKELFSHFAAQAFTAWFCIRLISGFVDSIFLKGISVVVWLILLIYFLDLLPLATDILNTYWINLGSSKISVKTLFTGVILFTIILWCIDRISHYLSKKIKQSTKFGMSQKILYSKAITFTLFTITFLWGLKYIGLDITTLAVFGGGLGVGLGIGLQTLFSNIVSGLTLLLDRSVKPGDVIGLQDTYGHNTYGTVTRLEARYVTVVTREGKKHLIPNNDFITKPVESWSYRDEIIRVDIPIAVAFNSDVHLVKKILLKIAQRHPRVLQNPEPVCMMINIGDFAIHFELRFWIQDPVNGIGRAKSDILYDIWDEFKTNKIIIPYPQRDIHLYTKPN